MKDLMMSSKKLSWAIIAKVTREVFTQTKPLNQSRNVQQSENTRKIPSSLQEEQKLLDDNIVPAYDPIWWFVRYPLDMLWVMQVGTDYPRINMFGEEVPNLLQFILLGESKVVLSILERCPEQLLMKLMEIRYRIVWRSVTRFLNNDFQSLLSDGFYLDHFFGNAQQ